MADPRPRTNCHETAMLSEPEIWRAAQGVINRYGAQAPAVAAKCAHRLFMDNDLDGAAAWRRVLRAIEELQRMRPKVGERLN